MIDTRNFRSIDDIKKDNIDITNAKADKYVNDAISNMNSGYNSISVVAAKTGYKCASVKSVKLVLSGSDKSIEFEPEYPTEERINGEGYKEVFKLPIVIKCETPSVGGFRAPNSSSNVTITFPEGAVPKELIGANGKLEKIGTKKDDNTEHEEDFSDITFKISEKNGKVVFEIGPCPELSPEKLCKKMENIFPDDGAGIKVLINAFENTRDGSNGPNGGPATVGVLTLSDEIKKAEELNGKENHGIQYEKISAKQTGISL